MKNNILRINRFYTLIFNIDYITLTRILVSLFTLIYFLNIISDFGILFGTDAIFPNEVSSLLLNKIVLNNYKISKFLNLNSDLYETLFKFLYISSCLLVLVGYKYKYFNFMLLILHNLMLWNTPVFQYGMDSIHLILLCTINILPTNYNYTFFNINKLNITNDDIDYKFYIKLYLNLCYFFAGFDKALGYNWWNGESIWKVLHLPHFQYNNIIDFTNYSEYKFIFVILGISTIMIEMFYFLINFKNMKNLILLSIILLHTFIAFFLNLYYFSLIMIIFNLIAYFDINDFIKKENEKEYNIL